MKCEQLGWDQGGWDWWTPGTSLHTLIHACITVTQRYTIFSLGQPSLGRDSLGRDSLGRDSLGRDSLGPAKLVSALVPTNPGFPVLCPSGAFYSERWVGGLGESVGGLGGGPPWDPQMDPESGLRYSNPELRAKIHFCSLVPPVPFFTKK